MVLVGGLMYSSWLNDSSWSRWFFIELMLVHAFGLGLSSKG